MTQRCAWKAVAGFGLRSLVVGAACMALAGARSTRAAEADRAAVRFLSALDLEGRAHRIGNGEDYRAVALVFLANECPVAREYVPELNRLAAALADQPVKFFGVIGGTGTTRREAADFQRQFKIEFPILFDASGELTEALAPTHVPEAFVLDAKAQVVYRGRIDDMYAEVGKKRPSVTTHELVDAIAAVLEGRAVATARTTPVGCPLEPNRSASAANEVTYSRHIAPILYANCVECHRPGEVAPFSLLSYDDAAKRAEFISEVTRGHVMPPWKAEIDFGHFLGERRLSDTQISLIEAWVKAGAPEGDRADLPPQPQFASGWRLGEPDLVLQAQAPCAVPASGADVFQHYIIPLDIPEDKTVVGYEFRPGNPSVVHHAILFLDTMGIGRQKDAETPEPGYTTFGSIGIPVAGIIGVWTPGMTPRFFPEGVGMPIRPKTDLVLQLHLHPSGKDETDQSSVALYFADKPVERRMAATPFVVGTLLIDIPAGADDHTVTSSVTLPTDVTLISLLPHMHLVGKEMKLTATLPDGKVEPLIWIKNWNFYWQDNYVYHEPLRLPEGTTLEVISRYDNSEHNPQNPSKPPARVLFGNDSNDEMCFGIFQLVADRPGEERKLQMALMQSFIKQWNDTSLAADARAVIMEEAAKLFGRDTGALFGSFLGGSQPRERRRERAGGGDTGPSAPSAP